MNDLQYLCVRLGNNVRAKRTELGYTQKRLAEKVGVSQPYVARIEAGQTWPFVSTFIKLAAALELQPDVLLKLPDTTP